MKQNSQFLQLMIIFVLAKKWDMTVSFNKNENYTTIVLKFPVIDAPAKESVVKEAAKHLGAGTKNLILVPRIEKLSPEFGSLCKSLNSLCEEKNGILVVAKPTEEMEQLLDDMRIIHTPTVDEATDYVFMEDISKQLGGEKEDNEEFGNWY